MVEGHAFVPDSTAITKTKLVFHKATLNEAVISGRHTLGIRVIALRCAGFNNVNIWACFGKNPGVPRSRVFALRGGRTRNGTASHGQPAHQQGLYPHPRFQFQPFRPHRLRSARQNSRCCGEPAKLGARLLKSVSASVCAFWHTTNFRLLTMGCLMYCCRSCCHRRTLFPSTAR